MASEKEHSLTRMSARADKVWGQRASFAGNISSLLGSSKNDAMGGDCWESLYRVNFVAPNFYLNASEPKIESILDCIEVGSDRGDRPLYYSLSTGGYAISTNQGLSLVAISSLHFFELFISYAEWVEEIIRKHDEDGFIDSSFNQEDVIALRKVLTSLLDFEFENSFWATEIDRLSSLTNDV